MHLFILLLFVGLFVTSQVEIPTATSNAWLGVILLPKVILAVVYAWLCRFTLVRLSTLDGHQALARLGRLSGVYRLAVLGLFFVDLALGAFGSLRHWILVDELLIMAPTMAMVIWAWWVYYPIDRRLRDIQLVYRIEEGLPIHPIWSRGQYVLIQFRYQVALVFVPLVLLLVLMEMIDRYVPRNLFAFDLRPLVHFCGAGCVFLFAPVVIRRLWDTVPLPAGEVRDRLTDMCKQYRVGVRELLLWRTFGGVINAAVMGLVRPLRYILLTDALLEMVPQVQVEAVMAHELAHVRRRHIFWMLCAALAVMILMTTVWVYGYPLVVAYIPLDWVSMLPAWLVSRNGHEHVIAVLSMVCWLICFGWISRRYERQADTFAVIHMADSARRNGHFDDVVVIDEQSVRTMIQALDSVARLNQLPLKRRSWRHGSIAWRQDYLRTLIGCPVAVMPIDRQVMCINAFSFMILVAAAVVVVLDI